jgi:hypothetical protein
MDQQAHPDQGEKGRNQMGKAVERFAQAWHFKEYNITGLK